MTVADDEWAASSRIGIVVREGRPAVGIDFRLVRGTLIQGAATIGPDRRPAEGRYVTLTQSGGSIPDELKGGDSYYHEVRMDRNATTDASGRYRLRMGPGTYSLQIQGQTMPETIKVQEDAELIRDFRLPRPERGPISGRVVLAEDPTRGVAGAKIEGVGAEPLAGLRLNVEADAEGRFRADRELKKMVVHAESPDRKLGGIIEIGGDVAEIVIPVGRTSTASGVILDELGTPVARTLLNWGRRVHLGDLEAPFSDCFGARVMTDERGRFVLPGLVVGQSYQISVPMGKDVRGRGRPGPSRGLARGRHRPYFDCNSSRPGAVQGRGR